MYTKLLGTTTLGVEIMNSNDRQRGSLVTWYKFAFAI